MPDQAAASVLTLAVDRSGNGVAVRCSGRLVAGVNDRLYLRSQPTDSELQTNPAGLDGSNPHGQHGPRHTGSAIRVRKIGRLRFATLQHWETNSATSWRYPSFVGIRGDWQQQHQVR